MSTTAPNDFFSIVKSLGLAARPKTFTAAFVPCLAGTCYASSLSTTWSLRVFFYALFSAVFIQIGTNLVNDAIDFKKGADTENRIGPKRVTQAGIFSFTQVMVIASLFFFLALILGIPLVLIGGWPMVIVGIVSILFGYGYTAGPYPLAYKGLGDLFVILFFGFVAVQGIFYLHTQYINWGSWVLGLQIGLLATVLIALNNLRDVHGDTLANKKTLAVRFGIDFAKFEIRALCLLPFFLNLFWLVSHKPFVFIIPFLSLPLAFKITRNVSIHPPGPIYNQFLAQAAALHLLFGLCLSIGFII